MTDYYQTHRESILFKRKQHYQKNRSRIREYQSQYYQLNRDKLLAKATARRRIKQAEQLARKRAEAEAYRKAHPFKPEKVITEEMDDTFFPSTCKECDE